ncbi:hypothetical protein CW706_03305 [Candidatus Bathyarchaeota archaeon]|nr:MAG: hypothetical protein CW706_03305 [Candidatus Bathyarchaeota archaeon]
MRKPIITLLSDFGLKDPYVAEMKAVILSICREALIIDISHEVEKFNVRMGAFLLAQAAPYFPKGTIHVAVVDPGVGTSRRAIITETKRSLYVGPDNGLLMLAAENDGIRHIYEISNPKYMLRRASRTFHGRDIFSPAAAYLATGVAPYIFGPEIHDPVKPSFSSPRVHDGVIFGEIIHVDGFGNLITNISEELLESAGISEGVSLSVQLGEKHLKIGLASSYGDVEVNTPLAIIGGTGFLEISVNRGNASGILGARVGFPVRVKKIVDG